jgi:hypothetical protein
MLHNNSGGHPIATLLPLCTHRRQKRACPYPGCGLQGSPTKTLQPASTRSVLQISLTPPSPSCHPHQRTHSRCWAAQASDQSSQVSLPPLHPHPPLHMRSQHARCCGGDTGCCSGAGNCCCCCHAPTTHAHMLQGPERLPDQQHLFPLLEELPENQGATRARLLPRTASPQPLRCRCCCSRCPGLELPTCRAGGPCWVPARKPS